MTLTVGDIVVHVTPEAGEDAGQSAGNAVMDSIRKLFDDGVAQMAAG